MKKILIALTLVLLMSGCDTENIQDNVINREHLQETYYTQEEVDSLLRQQNMEIRNDLLQYYVQSYDGKLYHNCRIEDSIKVCDEIILELDMRRALEYDLILKLLLDDTDIFEYAYENGQIKEINIINGTYEYHTTAEIITQILEELEETE